MNPRGGIRTRATRFEPPKKSVRKTAFKPHALKAPLQPFPLKAHVRLWSCASDIGEFSGDLVWRMSAPVFPSRLFKLNHKRLQRRLPKVRFGRAHVNARAAEFSKLFIGHSPKPLSQSNPVCGCFHSAVM